MNDDNKKITQNRIRILQKRLAHLIDRVAQSPGKNLTFDKGEIAALQWAIYILTNLETAPLDVDVVTDDILLYLEDFYGLDIDLVDAGRTDEQSFRDWLKEKLVAKQEAA